MVTNHNLSQGLLSSAGSYISLGNSQGDGKKGESSPSTGGRKRGKARGDTQAGARGRTEGSTRGGTHSGAAGNQKPTRDASTTTVTSLVIGPRSVNSHDAARPMSHKWRSQLCS
jgi:hypothetical protein